MWNIKLHGTQSYTHHEAAKSTTTNFVFDSSMSSDHSSMPLSTCLTMLFVCLFVPLLFASCNLFESSFFNFFVIPSGRLDRCLGRGRNISALALALAIVGAALQKLFCDRKRSA